MTDQEFDTLEMVHADYPEVYMILNNEETSLETSGLYSYYALDQAGICSVAFYLTEDEVIYGIDVVVLAFGE